MSIESFVQAMPKVEVNLRLEGAIPQDALIVIAEQNDVPLTNKQNKALLKLLEQPVYSEVDDLYRHTSKWLQQPEDFTRVVYDIGVALAKQNVKYVEVGFAPSLYADNGLTFEQLLTALNDGRARVERAWSVQIRWVLNSFRDEPRKLDDIMRWGSSTAAIKGGVVGIGIIGRETRGWVDEFERPLRTAQKKGLSRNVDLFDTQSDIQHVLEKLEPERFTCGALIAHDESVMRMASDKRVPLVLCMAHSVASGKVGSYADFPLRSLIDDGAVVSLCSGLPSLFKTTLNAQYLSAVRDARLSVGELETISLNAVGASFMPDESKSATIASFRASYEQLRSEHSVTTDTFA